MAKKLSASLVGLIYEAALKSFWRKKALARFLRLHGISGSFLASLNQESKREHLDRLFLKLPDLPQGQGRMLSMARDLIQQDEFPDLLGWEDSTEKIAEAKRAVKALKSALATLDEHQISNQERRKAQERSRRHQEEVSRARANLKRLDDRLRQLAISLGEQQAGYDFQDWFYDLMGYSEITCRRPYSTAGRQIDGALTISGTTYLVELKFTSGQASATDIDSFYKKVTDKADNTMGVMVSISGYSSTAIREASGPGTPLLLFDHSHLYLALTGVATFDEIVDRARRHASQTGDSFLPAARFNQ